MSGWTTVTLDATDEESAKSIRSKFDEAADENGGSRFKSDDCVKALVWGYGDETTMDVLQNNPDLWESAVVMNCNDTSDSGSGKAYVSEGGHVSEVDSASGVCGANGRDAAKELEHHISGYVYMR